MEKWIVSLFDAHAWPVNVPGSRVLTAVSNHVVHAHLALSDIHGKRIISKLLSIYSTSDTVASSSLLSLPWFCAVFIDSKLLLQDPQKHEKEESFINILLLS